jgi:transposase
VPTLLGAEPLPPTTVRSAWSLTDSHKRTHTAVAPDDVGRRIGDETVAATSEGHLLFVQSAAQWSEVASALEDCRHLTRRLERDLLSAGHGIVRVPTRLMAGARRGGRQPGKSDPIDAQAVAMAAVRHPDLPVAALDGPSGEVKLILDHRRDLVAERTRVHNRLRWHLHELDPTLQIQPRPTPLLCAGRTGHPTGTTPRAGRPSGPRTRRACPTPH